MNQPDTALESYGLRSDKETKRTGNGFDNLGIIPSLIKGIGRLNFENPTPIQKEAIPLGILGNDIIAIAQTGSGKTVAFGIPMLQRLSQMKSGTGLVVVPTRELALQVEESLQPLSRSVNIRSVVLIGGASMSMQRNALNKNPRVIIATPGRLMDHIEKRTVNLAKVKVLVLDEADRMLDMGFIPDIKKIVKAIPSESQTMLFSATMPREIEAIAETLMDNPTRVKTDLSGVTPAEVSHEMFFTTKQEKGPLLAVQLKQCAGPVLVFTKTKWMAKKLTAKVSRMGFAAAEIHSNRSQGQRQSALAGFRSGKYQILIATDIAARGIDVTGIELVINYDMPANPEDYVHRIGRTGRAGKRGHAVSFATADQKSTIRDIERFMKTKLAISTLPTMPSEKLLTKEAGQPKVRTEPSRNNISLKRKSPKIRPSKRPDSKSRDSKPKKSQPAEFKQAGVSEKSPFWIYFKKKRPSKKTSAGSGSGRKQRGKRK